MKTLGSSMVLSILLVGCGIQSIPQTHNQVDASWAEVMNQYKRRSDLVPNLVATVKGYAAHEETTLREVTEARANATRVQIDLESLDAEKLQALQNAQGALSSALSRLLAVAERYPDLKANANFRDLQAQLEGTENRIAIARRRYIESVKEFNNQVTVPPNSWTNGLFYHYEKKPQFTVEAAETQTPQVEF